MTVAPPEATLLPHQQLIKQYIIDHPHCGIFLGVGGGKTFTVLEALKAIRPAGHILIVAPVNIARSVWLNEISKWNIPLRTRSLITNERDKLLSRAKRLERYQEVFTDPPTMYFINQDLFHDLVENMPTTGKGRNKVFHWPFQTVIIDESQGFRNGSSRRFKAMKQARPAILRLIELTGTPVPNGHLDLWAQVYLLDEGLALGTSMTAYKERFFLPAKFVNGRPVKWDLRPGAKEEIYASIAHLVMSTENTSLELEPAIIQDISITMTDDELEAYNDFKRNLVMDLAGEHPGEPIKTIVAKNKAVLVNKLIQFAAGTLYTDDKHNYRVIHDHKIQMCDYLIRNTDGPVLIGYMFRSDREEILDKLTKAGHDVRAFDGSREMVRQWNAGEVPVMLLHPASAGPGLNLQDGGNTLIWYTLPHALDHYIQLNGRIDRMGQKNQVTIYRLLTQGTHDMRLPVNLKSKAMIQQGLLDAVFVDAEDVTALMGDLHADHFNMADAL
ncbi:SNF2-related protein [Arthrobacter koreensis]|uniref:SNF2-related protein n=1 Tax=Arthrobacter koreensis TaxID=199136 RepID=UPI003820673C